MANELKIRVVFDTGDAKNNVDGFSKGIKAVEGSLKDLENEWKKLEQIAKSQYAVGSPQQVQAIANASMAYKRYQEAVAQTSTIVAQNTRVSANAGTTLQALNYTIRDSPYFFRDFSLGILAVGNNLNPLIDGLIRMNKEAKAANSTLGKELLGSLKGTQGLVFGFSILVSVLQAVTFAMAKTKSGSDDLASSFDVLSGAANRLIKVKNPLEKTFFDVKPEQLDKTINAIQAQIDALDKSREAANRVLPAGAGFLQQMFGTDLKGQEEAVIKILKERKATLEAEKMVYDKMQSLGYTPQEEVETEKAKTANKEKQYIHTDAQLRAELSILQALQAQAQSARERLEYEKRIKDIQFELGLSGRMGGALDVEAGGFDFTGRKPTKPARLGLEATESAKRAKESMDAFMKVSIKEATDQLQLMQQVGKSVGDAIYDAFMHGKQGVDEFIKSVLVAIGRVLFLNFIEGAILSAFMPATSFTALGGVPKLLSGIPKPTLSAMSGNSNMQVLRQLEVMNANLALMQPVVNIYSELDELRFTKNKIRPSIKKLENNNVKVWR